MRTRTVKNIVALLIALIVFAIAATFVYVYVIDPLLTETETPDTPDDPDTPGDTPVTPDLGDQDEPVGPNALTIATGGEIYGDGDKCYFAEGANTFTFSHSGATVKISANPNCNFDYSVDSQIYRWSSVTDLSTAISLTTSSDSFTATIPDGDTIEALIARVHAVDETSVEVLSALPNSAPLFKITVSCNGQTSTLTAAYGFDVDSIELDQSQIIFG